MGKDKEKKEKKSHRSSKSKERSEKDKKSETGKSEKQSKKSAREKSADSNSRKSRKSKSPSAIDVNSQIDDGAQNLTAGFRTMSGIGTKLGGGMFDTFNPQITQNQACMLHGKPIRYYCDSCEELLCHDCTVMGPHNTQLHRICNLEEAFRYRFETINKSIHQSLVPKRA